MKKIYLITLLFATCSFYVNAQNLILNPGFENHNLTNGCYTNQSDSAVNASLHDITAFYGGSMDGIDIGVNDNCYAGGANSGSTHIVMAGLSGPNMFESISFNLSAPIIEGNTYDLTFYAANSSIVGSESLAVGVSTDSSAFGTLATSVPLGTNSTYTQYSMTFTAPADGDYLTIQPAEMGDFWFGLDDFSLEVNSVVGVENNKLTGGNIAIYPNPVNENFIRIKGIEGIENFMIFNNYGQELMNGEIGITDKIDVRSLSKGLYFLKLDNNSIIKFLKD